MPFRYKSNCTRSSQNIPFASDTDHFRTKAAAIKHMRNLEKGMSMSIIESQERGTLPSKYYILGDFTVIATAANYDDASLIAEALAKHSPLYEWVDVMSADGLLFHYICKDCGNDGRNHLQ